MNEKTNDLQYVTAKPTIKSFVGLRLLFAIAIFLHHYDSLRDLQIPGFGGYYDFLFEGFIGVNFFFILSGFVVNYGYGEKLKKHQVTDGQFVFYRFARLWPLHIVTLVMASCVYKAFGAWFTPNFWISISMLQSFVPVTNAAFMFNGLAWSISVEMFFYIAFCGLIYLSKKKKIVLLLVLIGASIVAINYSSQFNNIEWLIYINPFFRLMDFVAGMILSEFFLNMKLDLSKKIWTLLEISSLLLLVFMAYIAVKYSVLIFLRYDLYYIVPISILIFIFANNKGYISDLLSSKGFQFLGGLSFEIYLVHQMIINTLKNQLFDYLTSMNRVLVFTVITFTISVLVAIILHYFIGEPIYKKMRNMWDYFSTNGKGTYTNV